MGVLCRTRDHWRAVETHRWLVRPLALLALACTTSVALAQGTTTASTATAAAALVALDGLPTSSVVALELTTATPTTTSAVAAPDTPPAEQPWRADRALGLPAWLRLGLEHRARYEYLADDFRRTVRGDSPALSLRTRLTADLAWSPVFVSLELIDARAYLAEGAPLNDTIVNSVELVQAHLGLRGKDVLTEGDEASVAVGRLTMDLGSRRLIARNEFRNSTNAFTGIDARWKSADGHALRAFVLVPLRRLPSDVEGLTDNTIELDAENFHAPLWGVHYATPLLADRLGLEGYVVGLHEGDGEDAPSANRRLVTVGGRFLAQPSAGFADMQLEGMYQRGTSRASSAPTDTTDLSHEATTVHFSVGYTLPSWAKPRAVVQIDYASGDDGPTDASNERFDPLFGARRFELGATGRYGAITRSNLLSPGLRLEVTPHRTLDAFVSHRLVLLASPRDAWIPAGLRDATGAAGSFVGYQLEARVRWNVWPKNLALEAGAAVFVRGEFALQEITTTPLYVYGQLTGSI